MLGELPRADTSTTHQPGGSSSVTCSPGHLIRTIPSTYIPSLSSPSQRDTHHSQPRPSRPRWSKKQSSTTRWASVPARPRTRSRKPTGKAALSSSILSFILWIIRDLVPVAPPRLLASSTYPSDLTSLHRQKRDRELTPHLGKRPSNGTPTRTRTTRTRAKSLKSARRPTRFFPTPRSARSTTNTASSSSCAAAQPRLPKPAPAPTPLPVVAAAFPKVSPRSSRAAAHRMPAIPGSRTDLTLPTRTTSSATHSGRAAV